MTIDNYGSANQNVWQKILHLPVYDSPKFKFELTAEEMKEVWEVIVDFKKKSQKNFYLWKNEGIKVEMHLLKSCQQWNF